MLTLFHLFQTKYFPISQMKKVRPIVVKLLLHVPYYRQSQDSCCLIRLSDSWAVHLKTTLIWPCSVDGQQHLWQPPKYLCGQYPTPEPASSAEPLQGTEDRLSRGGPRTAQLFSVLYILRFHMWLYLERAPLNLLKECTWASAEIPEVVCKKPRLRLSPTWLRMETCPSACGTYTHFKALRRMEETGQLLRKPKRSKQLALYPYDLWTRMGLYTVLKLGQFLYCTFQFCASILMSFPGKSWNMEPLKHYMRMRLGGFVSAGIKA